MKEKLFSRFQENIEDFFKEAFENKVTGYQIIIQRPRTWKGIRKSSTQVDVTLVVSFTPEDIQP